MSDLPRLLAIDCATPPASVAVLDRGGLRAELVHDDERRADAWIGLAVPWCLRRADLDLAQLDGIAVCVGPGTFTGIRVGIATALGLAAPAGLPVAGVVSLEALAHIGLANATAVAACIDARRGQVYAALYEAAAQQRGVPSPLWGPAVCSPEHLAEVLQERPESHIAAIGSGTALLPDGAAAAAVPLAAAVGELALLRWPAGAESPVDWPPPEPVYLRPPDAKPPRNPLLSEPRRRSRRGV